MSFFGERGRLGLAKDLGARTCAQKIESESVFSDTSTIIMLVKGNLPSDKYLNVHAHVFALLSSLNRTLNSNAGI